jgi:hypothetical protein
MIRCLLYIINQEPILVLTQVVKGKIGSTYYFLLSSLSYHPFEGFHQQMIEYHL